MKKIHIASFSFYFVCTGGIEEQLCVNKPGEDVVILKNRKGFEKVALETGANLVPVYVFNERKAFVPQK